MRLKQPLKWLAMVGACMAWALTAHAQAIYENGNIRFNKVLVPGSGATIQIDADGTVSMGSQWLLTPGNAEAGLYRITGDPGAIDISITAVNTCDPSLSFAAFPAIWDGTGYSNIQASPITGAPFSGDDTLQVGARINFSGDAPMGVCAVSYDLNIITN